MDSPPHPPPAPPHSPPHSDFSFHVNPVQHPSDPSVVPGQNEISISALEPSTSSAMAPPPSLSSSSSSPAPVPVPVPVSRKLPPVPKFSADDSSMGPPGGVLGQSDNAIPAPEPSFSEAAALPPSSAASVSRKIPPVPRFSPNEFSMGPPPSKPRVRPRGLVQPPPVPKFEGSSGEKAAMGPPAPRVPSEVTPSSEPSSEELSPTLFSRAFQDLRSSATEAMETAPAADLPSASSLDRLEGNGGTQAHAVNLNSGTSALASAGVEASDAAVVSAGSVAVEGGNISLAEGGDKEVLRSAAPSSGASPSQPPYSKPSWSAAPGQPYSLEILKEGNILGVEDVSEKGAYMFGRSDRCDFTLEHPTVSRYHAVLQYNSKGESFVYDLGSTHGTFINKLQVKGKEYVPLHVGDIVRFGFSSRLHAFQGPLDLMPKEGLSKKERLAQRLLEASQDRAIRDASLMRGKRDAMTSDGISWGMQEDAEEEEEENVEEITWQTFKGELTEKQQKTLGKIHKYNEKLSNLKKENDAIQAKEISQGGLTQGQQTQIARNEQRMEQLVEEVENLEETLNESIQESINGRTGRRRRGKKNLVDNEDEDEDLSDDEFYDRASKLQEQKRKETVQKVETAESLLDKKAALNGEIETLHNAIKLEEQNPGSSQGTDVAKIEVESADPLDQFMTNLSSTILKDRTSQLQKELDSLTKDLERVDRLLKIADPTGEGLKKWELKKSVEGEQKAGTLTSQTDSRMLPRIEDAQELATSVDDVKEISGQIVLQEGAVDAREVTADSDGAVANTTSEEDSAALPGLEPPVRLGAPIPEAAEEMKVEFSDKVNEEAASFVTYKDRKKVKGGMEKLSAEAVVQIDGVPHSVDKKKEISVADSRVAESVALLLKHKRGLVTADADDSPSTEVNAPISAVEEKPPSKQSSKKRKKQGSARPSHMADTYDTEEWVPPAGQTGDGRTALNDKYGY